LRRNETIHLATSAELGYITEPQPQWLSRWTVHGKQLQVSTVAHC